MKNVSPFITLFFIALFLTGTLVFVLSIIYQPLRTANAPENKESYTFASSANDRSLQPTRAIPFFDEDTANDTTTTQVVVESTSSEQRDSASISTAPITSSSFEFTSWIPYWDQKRAFANLQEQSNVIDAIGLFWYHLDTEGAITKYEAADIDTTIIDFANSNGIETYVLIANLPDYDEGGSWDYRRVDRVISSRQVRIEHINDILELTRLLGVDGVHIDYEALKAFQRNTFTAFSQELAAALHSEGKKLGVALHAKNGESNPWEGNGSEAQDWAAIFPYIDKMYFMTYDEHWSHSEPGPVASLPWVRDVIQYALSIGVPREKIHMGVPLYGYDWRVGSKRARGVEYTDIQSIRSTYDTEESFNEAIASVSLTYTQNGSKQIIWFEDEKSFEAKLQLANTLGIGGVSLWRLGQENEIVWDLLR